MDLIQFKKNVIAGLPQTAHGEAMSLSEAQLRFWQESIDESPHSLDEWLQALRYFYSWEQTSLPLISKIEYVNCCIQGTQQSGLLLPLPDLLADYLKNYGVTQR